MHSSNNNSLKDCTLLVFQVKSYNEVVRYVNKSDKKNELILMIMLFIIIIIVLNVDILT